MTPATQFPHLALSSHPLDKKIVLFFPKKTHFWAPNSILKCHLDVGLSTCQTREEGWLPSLFSEWQWPRIAVFHCQATSRGCNDWRGEMETQGSFHDETWLLPFRMSRCPGKSRTHTGSVLVQVITQLVNTEWVASLPCHRPDKLRHSERKRLTPGITEC